VLFYDGSFFLNPSKKAGYFLVLLGNTGQEEVSVIGNIHDNHELLDSNTNPYKGRDDERKCRCNWCTAEFMEGEIVVKGDAEYCPSCGESGCIADDIEAAKCDCGGICERRDASLRHND